MVVDMAGHNLDLEAKSDRIATGIYAGNNQHITIKNEQPAGALSITAENTDTRAAAGIRKRTLIVNLPGSEKAVRECLGFILPELRHGIEILRGDTGECAR